MFGSKHKSRISVFKLAKTKILLVFACILFVILIYDYIFYSPSPSTPLKDATSYNDLIPGMLHETMINPIGSTSIVLTVFYECLCPDSKSFFLKHLLPSIQKAPKLISAVLIPYGKAKTEAVGQGDYKFKCQHGEVECYGNKVHACTIAKVHDPLIQIQVISCMIAENISPDEIGKKCCSDFNVPWAPIHSCATGKEGSLLLKQHGDKTNALYPPIGFIPTILINDSRENQAAILKNLWKEICRTLNEVSPKPHELCDV